jgi:CDP-6-deoxy-D-xylo-4-hexulose-3-dehydrase
MVFPIFLNPKLKNKKKRFINRIEKNGLQTRPIISGSFVNQPATKLYSLNDNREKFKGADTVEELGFVIGLHTKKINIKQVDFIKNTLFLIDKT